LPSLDSGASQTAPWDNERSIREKSSAPLSDVDFDPKNPAYHLDLMRAGAQNFPAATRSVEIGVQWIVLNT
jgi:hypothetical protein